MSNASNVVIVGGGIVGLACAYELARAGVPVTLLEYGKPGMQATNAAAGMLTPISGEAEAPDAMMRWGMEALAEYPELVASLQNQCEFDLEFIQDGILKVAFGDAGAEALRRRFTSQRKMDIPLEWLDGVTCREVEPRLSERVVAGVFSPSEATISNQLLALALQRAAVSHGAIVRERAPVTRFVRDKRHVTAVEAGGERFACDTLIIAAGARSGQMAKLAGLALPVHPIRGQMIAFGGMRTPIRQVVWGLDGYLVPRANGLIFAGATVEDVGFRRRTTQAGIRAMRSMAVGLVPQLAAATVHFDWAGLRPGTEDGLPIIGPLPDSNVIAATGHYRNGILLGPITGAAVARGITTGDWSGVPVEFSPERFA